MRNYGHSLQLNGSSAFVDLGNGSGLKNSTFTRMAWIFPNNVKLASVSAPILGDSNASSGIEYRLDTSTGKQELLKQGISSIAKSNTVIPYNQWVHVAITYDSSGNYIFYLNGEIDGAGTNLQTFSSGNTYIGKANTTLNEWFGGYIDDVRIYNTVLSPAQIQNIYLGISDTITAGLQGHYKFNEGAGSSAIDSSGNGNTGTITNGAYSTNVAFKPRSMILRDTFIDTSTTSLSSHIPIYSPASWTQTASNSFYILNGTLQPNRFTDNDKGLLNIGVNNFSLTAVVIPYSSGVDAAYPGIVFRYVDDNNYWYCQADAKNGEIDIYSVIAGTFTKQVRYNTTVTSGVPVCLRIDCADNAITLYVNGSEITTYISSFNQTAGIIGVRIGKAGTPSNPSWTSLEVIPFSASTFNWPIFTRSVSNPLVTRGAAYDSHDCNDPNVCWDPNNNRYVLYYSAYNGSGDQTTALAYASSPEGPWTKYSNNPVFDNNSAGFGEDGGLVLYKGLWYHTYGMSSSNAIGMATSPDLITWTNQGQVIGNSNWHTNGTYGSFLRVTQDGNTLQLWYAGRDGGSVAGIGMATSTNGLTFTDTSSKILAPIGSDVRTDDFGSPGVFVPPGKENKEMLVIYDSSNVSGNVQRVLSLWLTIDNGITWHNRYAALAGSGVGWDSAQTIDGNLVLIGNTLYLFYAGCDVNGGTVNLDGQIGVALASWPYTSFIAS